LSRETLAGVSPETIIANANSSSAQNTTRQNNKQYSYGGIERMSFGEKRAFLVGGARYTNIESVNQTGTAAAATTNDATWSTSMGGVVKAYRGEKRQVSLFCNANETFVPVFAIDQRLETFGEKFPNRTVSIKEYGIKLDMLDSRLVTTASWYKTNENNVLISIIDVDGTVTGAPAGATRVRRAPPKRSVGTSTRATTPPRAYIFLPPTG
jgi:outer membrane receptor for ferric coprogen and ferric-rhodotorulic acid